MRKSFVIDSLPESALRYRSGCAVVAVDVIRSTTMAITAVASGRQCYPVNSLGAAFLMAKKLRYSLLAGEVRGARCAGLDMRNSPAELESRGDTHRPLILLASSATRLMVNARGCDALYLACFRNSVSMGCRLISEQHPRIALLGVGSQGEFREEDQICCAWIAALLARSGYVPEDETTVEVLNRWASAKATDCLVSRSVKYLRRTGQLADLNFILERIDDLDEAFILQNDEVITVKPGMRTAARFTQPVVKTLHDRNIDA